MVNNNEKVNSFLDSEYAKSSKILRNGELFSVVNNEESNVIRTIESLERNAKIKQQQQKDFTERMYQVKINSLDELQRKLAMYGNSPAMLKPDDMGKLSTMLADFRQLLESQKKIESQSSQKDIEAQQQKSIEEYKKSTQVVIEKHLQEAKDKLNMIKASYEPLEQFFETASLNSSIWNKLKNDYPFPVINQIQLGEIEIKSEGPLTHQISYNVPEVIPFFNRKSLTIIYKNNERDKLKNLLDNVLARCLMASEAGNFLFHFIDGNGNGSLFFDYLKVSNKTLQLFDGKINITPQEIDGCLQKLMLTYKEIDQKIRKGDSIVKYNAEHPKSRLPYHIVVMDSFPKGVSSSYLPYISRMMNDELEAGLHFIFLVEEQDFSKAADVLSPTSVYRIPDNYIIQGNMGDILQKILSFVDSNFTTQKTMLFEEYYKNVEWWQDDCSNYTRIPLGLSYANNYNLTFNEEGKDGLVASANAVIVGMPGCGKSCLLNTMIIGASIMYSPDELRFYMIDMKGVGFKQYVTEKLPHAEFIALKANPEFGLHTLRNLREKMDERQVLFSNKDALNYYEFRNKYPDEVMPRYMILIDEYQELLKDETRAEVLEILRHVVRVGRGLGFNIILSSQNMDLTESILVNISHRIIMRCSTAIGHSALGSYDERTPQLNTGQAIIHCENTDVVQSYYLPGEVSDVPQGGTMSCRTYLKQIRDAWDVRTKGKYDQKLVVFDSEVPALLSNNRTYKSLTFNHETINKELLFSPGEKYMVDGSDFMRRLSRNKNENILIVGGQLQVSTRAANTTFLSMLPQLDSPTRIDILSYQDRSEQTLFDAIHISSANVCNQFTNATFHEQESAIEPLLEEIVEDIKQRKTDASKGILKRPRLLVIYRADGNARFNQIKVMDEDAYEEKYVSSEQTALIKQILEDGPQVGVHSIIHFSDTNGYFDMFDTKDKTYFVHRILLQMNEDDSETFLDSYLRRKTAAGLVDNDAKEANKYNMSLYWNVYDNSKPVILKPYEFMN